MIPVSQVSMGKMAKKETLVQQEPMGKMAKKEIQAHPVLMEKTGLTESGLPK